LKKGVKMHKTSIAFTVFLITFISCSDEPEFTGRFGHTPEKIFPGGNITVYYNPDSTVLAGRTEIKCIAHLFNDRLINTVDVVLVKKANHLEGEIKTTDETLGILLKFKSEEELDNNEKNGYVIFLTDESGKNLAGSLAGYAAAINKWGAYYADLDRDKEKALKLFEKEFASHPGIKEKFLDSYLEVIYAVKQQEREKVIEHELQLLENKTGLTEDNYEVLANWYSKLNDETKSIRYDQLISQKFPSGKYMQQKFLAEFRNETDLNKKLELLYKFENQFPESEYVETMYDLTANAYRDMKDYSSALGFLQTNQNNVHPFRFYSVAKRMLEENADMNSALEICKLGEERNRQEVKTPSGKKPEYYSESEWKEDREYLLGLNLFTYGNVLYNSEKKKDSLPFLEEAVALTKRKEGDINDLYSKALVETGDFSKALDEISLFIMTGNGTVRMKDYLKEAYINEKGTTEGFITYSAQFEDAAKEQLINKLERNMIVEPAPAFTLKDIDGNNVSLSDFRGKTIILDFWATWCGPCLASFPAMKKSVEKYHDNPKVKFLFINSWERIDEKKRNAKDFIAKNDYPFHVLLDEDNKVIESFKVSGIPTKFVIDGNGNIRFMSVGYSGSVDQLVEELSLMISMVQ